MSMEVDFTSPLTEEERAYLESRGKYADIERTDQVFGVETPEYGSGDGSGLRMQPALSSEQAALRKENLLRELKAIEDAERGNDTEEDGDGDLPPYSAWKPADLKAELKVRNLSDAGTKNEMVSRLEEDDAKVAGQH